jgi:glycosyltransferase involved in cell wall biosynthesis
MDGHLVSVIVPTYNRADCIGETLDCLLAQTHTNWELVLVDDGSTDDTRSVVEERFRNDDRLRYVYQQNAGVSHARNTGLATAKGDFIAFLDSDDRWKPWKLAAQIACMNQFPDVGMVWTEMEAIDETGALMEPRHLRTMYSAYEYHQMDTLFSGSVVPAAIEGMPSIDASQADARFYYGDIFRPMILGSLVHTSTVLLRRDRALAVGGFDETLKYSGEDYDFHLRTCELGPVGLLDVPSIQYRKGRADRLTRHTAFSAINFLATVEKAIAADSAGRLRKQDIDLVLTGANEWVAEEYFKLGDGKAVRRHALVSLQRRPGQRRLIALMLLSYVPHSALQRLLHSYRAIKRRLRGTAHENA